MDPKFFIKRVPQSLIAVMGAGLLIGAFYGLAPLYASQQGLSTELVGWYMGCCIFAGFPRGFFLLVYEGSANLPDY